MGNLGGGEILVILLLALVVLGPERLPEVARQIGKVLGDIRRVSAGFQEEMRSAMHETGLDEIAGRRIPPPARQPRPNPPAEIPRAEPAQPVSGPATAQPPDTGAASPGADQGPAGAATDASDGARDAGT